MNIKMALALIVIIGIAVAVLIAYLLMLSRSKPKEQLKGLLQPGVPRTKEEIQRIKQNTSLLANAKAGRKKDDIETLLFKAGYYSDEDKLAYKRSKYVLGIGSPIIITLLLVVSLGMSPLSVVLGLSIGILVGLTQPRARLDKAARLREEEIQYYLPLIIEEISIGTSGGLEPGNCIAQILHLASTRDSHNAATDLFTHVIRLVRSGMNLEGALNEVGMSCGKSDAKHALMFLGQSIKHGGELSKQLQDLADTVAMNKQTAVEAKITALPVKATFPLFLVFGGFFLSLIGALAVRLITAFQGA